MTEEVKTDKPVKARGKYIIAALGVLLLVAFILGGSYIYWQLSKITYTDLDQSNEALGINPEATPAIEETQQPPLNIALFGVDQEVDIDSGRSDVIMIMSIDKKNRAIKLCSVMRDTYVNIPGYGMDKLNHAYAYGGPQLAISTLNSNFDLDIKDCAAVSFSSMAKVIDIVGGVDIEVYESEVPHIRGVESAGLQHLNGEQAVDYMRIRYVGHGDYQRTERQRTVLAQIISNELKVANPDTLPDLVSALLPYVSTSFSKADIVRIGLEVLAAQITTVKRERLPLDSTCEGRLINGIYYLVADLPANKAALHKYIYENVDMPH